MCIKYNILPFIFTLSHGNAAKRRAIDKRKRSGQKKVYSEINNIVSDVAKRKSIKNL